MTAPEPDAAGNEHLLSSKVSIPEHVAFRSFAHETVILNLETGKYHGLDRIGGRLFELLPRADSLRAAARQLAEEYGQPLEAVELDAVELCVALRERGLLEFESA
jgi:hypothetical protein